MVAADTEREAGKGSRAREGVATLFRVVRRTGNFCVVGGDDSLGNEKKSSTSISDSINGLGLEGGTADGITAAGKLPETVGGVDGDVCDGTSVFR